VLKLMPGGVALIPKLAMAPPVEEIVNPVAAVLTVLVSDEAERVKAGAARVGVGVGVGAAAAGSAGGVAVVIDGEMTEGSEEPAALVAVNENV
jgi:hypothetical protein